uniref:Uncharacterized protein n=1 Tax=Octopus bimaculoides TaxID=37653 RepID=A0A0L8GWI9_OCTBM
MSSHEEFCKQNNILFSFLLILEHITVFFTHNHLYFRKYLTISVEFRLLVIKFRDYVAYIKQVHVGVCVYVCVWGCLCVCVCVCV